MKPPAAALGLLLLLASPAGSQERADHADSSMLAWTEAVAGALAARLPDGADGALVRYEGGRGVDARKVGTVFRSHLQSALRGRDITASRGPAVDVSVSLDGARMWAVGVVHTEPERAFAVSWPVDRELEALLGATATGAGNARWRLERIGTVPAGVLDVVLLDLDDDGSDDLALLGVDGVRTYRYDAGDARPTALGGPFALPDRPWPRTVAGRLVEDDGALRAGTTAGHYVRVDPRRGSVAEASRAVPLPQPRDPAWPNWLPAQWVLGGPDLKLVEGDAPLPGPGVRDLQRFPGADGAWIWIDAAGRLGGVDAGETWSLPDNQVFGDRLLLVELEGAGLPEVVTTGASPFGEPDQVAIHRLEGSPPRLSVLFRASFAGTVRALGTGDLDFDGRPDVVLVEEDASDEAVLWRLERSP